ncbi:cation-translocating P-type ATPase [Caulobacter zeae]|uniref:cation-translocating P-type ATPase n=1 Tax=Caulobacter zeae TaxID=2055137 RepID=UPI001F0B8DB9|nr:cation-translocating P-type ATPase [Caulobacter zeae]
MDNPLAGLTEEEARDRLAAVGLNVVSRPGRRGLSRILLEALREPMFLLLLGAAVLYLAFGNLGEGVFMVIGASASVGLVVLQEARSERALEALLELAQPRARVVRDGVERLILARDIVPGDLVLVGEGERLPADGDLVGEEVLQVDESVLTGEAAPVSKFCAKASNVEASALAEVASALFSGTLVVRGQGVMRVSRTGAGSALGQIAGSLAAIRPTPSPLQQTAGRLTTMIGATSLVFCLLVAMAYGVARGDWVAGALAGITVAIALIPEEFPMVLAVFFALGAWRLANHQVLVRRSAAIETLGAASVLCVDKTGTLTENRMRVSRLWTAEGEAIVTRDTRLAGSAAELLRIAALASASRPVDPMDKAIRDLAGDGSAEFIDAGPCRLWPLSPQRMAIVQLWRRRDGIELAAAKGAPEAIFALCDLSALDRRRHQSIVERFAAEGLRVLGVASVAGPSGFLTDPAENAFAFQGLVAFEDPLRPDARAALQEAQRAGVKVIMITGDHPATALAIARSAGLDVSAGVLSGSDLEELSAPALAERMSTVRVFARIAPEQKLRLVEALKTAGEVVAMTGDGVNDAPALEAAHIGVAMGRRGSDVAREAADLVLLDDSFASIVGGVRLGRRIFANLRRALTYVTAIHVPIAGLALAPILMGLPPLLMPLHVVLLELIIDPTSALAFEAEPSAADAMRLPPRRPDEMLFGRRQIALAILQGLVLLAGVLGLYVWALDAGRGEAAARGAALLALVVGNLILALTDSASSGRVFIPQRRSYGLIVLAVAGVMTTVLAAPPIAKLFAIAVPDGELLALSLAVAILAGGGGAAGMATLTKTDFASWRP